MHVNKIHFCLKALTSSIWSVKDCRQSSQASKLDASKIRRQVWRRLQANWKQNQEKKDTHTESERDREKEKSCWRKTRAYLDIYFCVWKHLAHNSHLKVTIIHELFSFCFVIWRCGVRISNARMANIQCYLNSILYRLQEKPQQDADGSFFCSSSSCLTLDGPESAYCMCLVQHPTNIELGAQHADLHRMRSTFENKFYSCIAYRRPEIEATRTKIKTRKFAAHNDMRLFILS